MAVYYIHKFGQDLATKDYVDSLNIDDFLTKSEASSTYQPKDILLTNISGLSTTGTGYLHFNSGTASMFDHEYIQTASGTYTIDNTSWSIDSGDGQSIEFDDTYITLDGHSNIITLGGDEGIKLTAAGIASITLDAAFTVYVLSELTVSGHINLAIGNTSRIKNLADGVLENDAVNLGQVTELLDTTIGDYIPITAGSHNLDFSSGSSWRLSGSTTTNIQMSDDYIVLSGSDNTYIWLNDYNTNPGIYKNELVIHSPYISIEGPTDITGNFTIQNGNTISFEGNKLSNVGDATLTYDAVNLGQLNDLLSSYAEISDLSTYLPLSAGSGKSLTGSLYASSGLYVTGGTSNFTNNAYFESSTGFSYSGILKGLISGITTGFRILNSSTSDSIILTDTGNINLTSDLINMQGELHMNSYKITNLSAATDAGDAVRYDQLNSFATTTYVDNNFATTTYVDNGINGIVLEGNYLPLSAGSSNSLTGSLYISGSNNLNMTTGAINTGGIIYSTNTSSTSITTAGGISIATNATIGYNITMTNASSSYGIYFNNSGSIYIDSEWGNIRTKTGYDSGFNWGVYDKSGSPVMQWYQYTGEQKTVSNQDFYINNQKELWFGGTYSISYNQTDDVLEVKKNGVVVSTFVG